jgi:two-component system, NtrC family, sensor kinase
MDELTSNRRILIVDDNHAIHDDFKKVLGPTGVPDDLAWIERELLGVDQAAPADGVTFELESAMQGHLALEQVQRAVAAARPFAVAFVDVRMPPGWDGIETIPRLWQADPQLQIVICSAHSDYTWDDIRKKLGSSDGLLILKKPFDRAEVLQIAHALTRKWSLQAAVQRRAEQLEELVRARTGELEREMAERRKVEAELRLAQKLEAIGRLASGIAHEINTPTQYVSDNVQFLRTSFDDLERLRVQLRAAVDPVALPEIEELERELEVDFLTEQVPKAFNSTLDGLTRIAKIVQAMKELGHNGNGDQSPIDLNRTLLTTLEVARNEYKYVADVETELGELPLVTCHGGELGQVFLNLIVNAAHAIEAAGGGGTRGMIKVKSSLAENDAVISIADTGCGIPAEIQARIFDPFFTTKEVGRGSGQGLAIARSVIDRHGGSLTFASEPGRGTTFHVRIPVAGRETHNTTV